MPTLTDRFPRLRGLLAAATAAWLLVLPQVATAQEAVPAGPATEDTNDPLEPINRAIFWFNEALDVVLIRPAAEIYRAVLPQPAQTGVRNALRNLRSPLDLANQTLQGDWDGAGNVLQRFALNSTIGVAGLIDVAAQQGIPYEYESFDQTLAVWGIPEGPYLVLPLLGSSSLRDAAGFGGEYLADPVTIYAENNGLEWATYTRAGLLILDTRAGYIDAIDDLRRNSFDYYAAMRSLYRQRRDSWIRDGAPDPQQYPDIPDYEAADQ